MSFPLQVLHVAYWLVRGAFTVGFYVWGGSIVCRFRLWFLRLSVPETPQPSKQANLYISSWTKTDWNLHYGVHILKTHSLDETMCCSWIKTRNHRLILFTRGPRKVHMRIIRLFLIPYVKYRVLNDGRFVFPWVPEAQVSEAPGGL